MAATAEVESEIAKEAAPEHSAETTDPPAESVEHSAETKDPPAESALVAEAVDTMPGQRKPGEAVVADSAPGKETPADTGLATEVAPVEAAPNDVTAAEASPVETAQPKESPLDAALAAAESAPLEVVSTEMKHVDTEAPTPDVTEGKDSSLDNTPVAEDPPEEIRPVEEAPPAAEEPVEVAPEAVPAEETAAKDVAPPEEKLGETATAPEEEVSAETMAAKEPQAEGACAGTEHVDVAGDAELAPAKTQVEDPPTQAATAETAPAECVPDAEVTPESGSVGVTTTANAPPEESTKADPASEPSETSVDGSKTCSFAAKILGEDSNGRDELIRTLKERCLAFLSEELPHLKIQQIHSVEDGFEYTIDNVDLSGFKVNEDSLTVELAPDVESARRNTDPILDKEPPAAKEESAGSDAANQDEKSKPKAHERDAVRVTSANLCVIMPELKWSYQQSSFPYMHGSGLGRACLSGGSVTLAFQLCRADVDGQVVLQLSLSSCSVFVDSLPVEVRESVFSWVYNQLTHMFQDTIRQYIASSLQAALSEHIGSMLGPLNGTLGPHYPLLVSAMGLTTEALPSAGDAAKPAAPKEEGITKKPTGGWPPATPPQSPTATEEAAAAAAAAAASK